MFHTEKQKGIGKISEGLSSQGPTSMPDTHMDSDVSLEGPLR